MLSLPAVYRAWQAPFVQQKAKPFLDRNSPASFDRVIDIGCGPGTNSELFQPEGYIGVDLSEAYVENARVRHKGYQFEVWDVTTPSPEMPRFDLAFMNSIFHHLSDDQSHRLLGALPDIVTPGGRVAIIDLVLPEKKGIPWALAKADRGEHPRTMDSWNSLFAKHLEISVIEKFAVRGFGVPLWELVYCQGLPL